MTREAKIGLLTGLAVIVLIGILLSEYLGGPAAGAGPGGAGRERADGDLADGGELPGTDDAAGRCAGDGARRGRSTADAGNTAVAAGPVGGWRSATWLCGGRERR